MSMTMSSNSINPQPADGTTLRLGLILLLGLIVRRVFFTGTAGGDDQIYSAIIGDMLKGTSDFNARGIFLARVGLIYPAALFAWLTGCLEIGFVLYPLLCSMGCIVVAFLLGRLLFSPSAGLTAALLLAVYPFDVRFSTGLFCTTPLMFFMALSVYLFLLADRTEPGRRRALLYLCSGLSAGAGYLVKVPSLLLALVFAAYLLYNRRIRGGHFLVVMGVLLVVAAESAALYPKTHQLLGRLAVASGSVSPNQRAYFQAAGHYSLATYPRIAFVSCYMFGLMFHAAVAAAAYFIVKRSRPAGYVLLWLILLSLYLQFGSINLTRYEAIGKSLRYLGILTVPLAVLVGAAVDAWRGLWSGWFARLAVGLLVLTSLAGTDIAVGFQQSYSRNARLIARQMRNLPRRPIYTNWENNCTLNYFFRYQRTGTIKLYAGYDFVTRQTTNPVDLAQVEDCYVIDDEASWSYYSRVYKMKRPALLDEPPSHWQPVVKVRDEHTRVGYLSIRFAGAVLRSGLVPSALAKRFLDTIAFHTQPHKAVVYYVPESRTPRIQL